jgi:hypothetical protein
VFDSTSPEIEPIRESWYQIEVRDGVHQFKAEALAPQPVKRLSVCRHFADKLHVTRFARSPQQLDVAHSVSDRPSADLSFLSLRRVDSSERSNERRLLNEHLGARWKELGQVRSPRAPVRVVTGIPTIRKQALGQLLRPRPQ